jgi:hypothetical protein
MGDVNNPSERHKNASALSYEPPSKPEGRRCSKGSVGALQQISKLQRVATLAITGALRSTPTDTLDLHADLLPAGTMLWSTCYRAYARLCTLPQSHALHNRLISAHANRERRLKHRSALEKLVPLYDEDPFRTEKIGIKKDRERTLYLRHPDSRKQRRVTPTRNRRQGNAQSLHRRIRNRRGNGSSGHSIQR